MIRYSRGSLLQNTKTFHGLRFSFIAWLVVYAFPALVPMMIALAPFELVGPILVWSGKPIEVDTVAPGGHFSHIAVPPASYPFLDFSTTHTTNTGHHHRALDPTLVRHSSVSGGG